MDDGDSNSLLASLNQITDLKIRYDVSPLFAAVLQNYPTQGGGIDWSKCRLLGEASIPQEEESDFMEAKRMIGAFAAFQEACSLAASDRVVILSDDYLDFAIEATIESVPKIVELILPLPHGICVLPLSMASCFEIRFCGSCYFGTPKRIHI